MLRYSPNTIEDLRGLLFGNMRVQIESGVAVTAKTVADLRALPTWPDGLVLVIHVSSIERREGGASLPVRLSLTTASTERRARS